MSYNRKNNSQISSIRGVRVLTSASARAMSYIVTIMNNNHVIGKLGFWKLTLET